jgi:hypothetical protein
MSQLQEGNQAADSKGDGFTATQYRNYSMRGV